MGITDFVRNLVFGKGKLQQPEEPDDQASQRLVRLAVDARTDPETAMTINMWQQTPTIIDNCVELIDKLSAQAPSDDVESVKTVLQKVLRIAREATANPSIGGTSVEILSKDEFARLKAFDPENINTNPSLAALNSAMENKLSVFVEQRGNFIRFFMEDKPFVIPPKISHLGGCAIQNHWVLSNEKRGF